MSWLTPEGIAMNIQPQTRTGVDSMGPIQRTANRLWGAQAQRSLAYFSISGERIFTELIHALAQVKRACALVNTCLTVLDASKAQAIFVAADEVLANWASQWLCGARCAGRLVHPNDEVSRSQSFDHVFPTARHEKATFLL